MDHKKIYTATYYDDVETLKTLGYLERIFSVKTLEFAAHCDSLKCLKYMLIYNTRHDYIIDIEIAATQGDSVRILQYILKRERDYDFMMAMFWSTNLNKKNVLEWLPTVDEDYNKEYLDKSVKSAPKRPGHNKYIERYNRIQIIKPKITIELWHDYDDEYDSHIQWLPREMMEDVEKLVVDSIISCM